jgi:hypothetical protein
MCIGLGFRVLRHHHHHHQHPSTLLYYACTALMALGECLNFAAYGIAPASLVAAMDPVAVAMAAHTMREIFGAALVAGGTVAVVGNAPWSDDGGGGEDVFGSWRMVWFTCALSLLALGVANPTNTNLCLPKRTLHTNVAYYTTVSACMGTLTVVAIKAISAGLSDVDDVSMLFWDPLFYILIAALPISTYIQTHFTTTAIREFGTGQVVTAYHAIFTTLAVSAGFFVFHETVFLPGAHAALFTTGLLLSFTGVLLIAGRRHGGGGIEEWETGDGFFDRDGIGCHP